MLSFQSGLPFPLLVLLSTATCSFLRISLCQSSRVDAKQLIDYLIVLFSVQKTFEVANNLKAITVTMISHEWLSGKDITAYLRFALFYAYPSEASHLSSDRLGQGWQTFFDRRAKILKKKFSKLMLCHYIKSGVFNLFCTITPFWRMWDKIVPSVIFPLKSG